MNTEDLIKRAVKKEAAYSEADKIDTNISDIYSYRLKEIENLINLEEKISRIYRWRALGTSYNSVKQPYRIVKKWNKNEKYPVGLNNIPHEGMMVMKFSDGSIATFSHQKYDEIGGTDL